MVNLEDVNIGMFGFTEIVENSLPNRASGWAQAFCDPTSIYYYGKTLANSGLDVYYNIIGCQQGPVGSHGGCSYCAMCLVTVELKPEYTEPPGEEPPGEEPPGEEPPGEEDSNKTMYVVLGAIVLAGLIGAVLYYKRRK
jgi:LPXTG-motif cell wall-anchored protein